MLSATCHKQQVYFSGILCNPYVCTVKCSARRGSVQEWWRCSPAISPALHSDSQRRKAEARLDTPPPWQRHRSTGVARQSEATEAKETERTQSRKEVAWSIVAGCKPTEKLPELLRYVMGNDRCLDYQNVPLCCVGRLVVVRQKSAGTKDHLNQQLVDCFRETGHAQRHAHVKTLTSCFKNNVRLV